MLWGYVTADKAGCYDSDNEPCSFLQASPMYLSKFNFSRSSRIRSVSCDEIQQKERKNERKKERKKETVKQFPCV